MPFCVMVDNHTKHALTSQYANICEKDLSMDSPPADLGARLRAARGYMGLTISEMGNKLGRNRATIRTWEAGQTGTDPLRLAGLVKRYSEISGLPEWWFLTPDLTKLQRPQEQPANDRVKKAQRAKRAVRQRRQDKDPTDDETRPRKAAGSQ